MQRTLASIGLVRPFVVALFVAAVLAPPHLAVADPGLDDYNVAIALYKDKRWELAAASFEKFISRHPRHERMPYARLYLGLSLTSLEKYDDARTAFRDFVRNHPQNKNLPDAMYRAGECSYLLDDLKAAEAEFSVFLQKYPEHDLVEWALPYLADAQLRQDKPDAAAANFEKSLELYPKSRMAEDARFGLARAYEALHRSADAVRLYRELASNANGSRAPQAQLNLGARYFDDGKFDEAAAAYAQLVERFPESPLAPVAQLNAGYSYYKLRDFEKAAEQFDGAAQEKSQAPTANYWKGLSYKLLGRYPDAGQALQAVVDAAPDEKLAPDAQFQWADAELRAGNFDAARKLFLEYARRWPKTDLAADSLHFAGEAALRAGDFDATQQLLDRFEREFPNNRLRMHAELLQARLDEARGGEENLQRAVARFRKVLDESTLPATRSRARFHLARTYQKRGDHDEVVEVLAPLVRNVLTKQDFSEFDDALVMQGMSFAALGKHQDAANVLSEYLMLAPDGDQAAQALSSRAVAAVHLDDKQQAEADLQTLAERFPGNPLGGETTQRLAEYAYAEGEWVWASELFDRLVRRGPDSPYHAAALSGLGWSQFQQQQYREAALSFAQLVSRHPTDPLAPEAAFKQAESMQKAAETDAERAEAASAFAVTFEKLVPARPAAAGAETAGPVRYAYLAGLEAARSLRKLERIKEADAVYERLTQAFPKAKDLDLLIDEWAVMHYEVEDFKRADDLFGRLVRDFPQSSRADDARLNLAESDYIAGRLDLARQAFEPLTADPQADPIVQHRSLYNLAKIAVEQRQWKAVAAHAADFSKRFPADKFPEIPYRSHVEFLLGEAQLNLERPDEALKSLAAVREQAEAAQTEWFPRIYVLLAEANLRLKKYDEVAALVAEFRTALPESPFLHQADEVLGRSFKNQAKFDEARKAFQRVLEDPHGQRTETAAKAQFLIAETYLLQKDHKTAQAEYFKVYHLYDFPEWQAFALFQAARCDEALGQWKEAVKSYEELIAKFPESKPADDARVALPNVQRKAAG